MISQTAHCVNYINFNEDLFTDRIVSPRLFKFFTPSAVGNITEIFNYVLDYLVPTLHCKNTEF